MVWLFLSSNHETKSGIIFSISQSHAHLTFGFFNWFCFQLTMFQCTFLLFLLLCSLLAVKLLSMRFKSEFITHKIIYILYFLVFFEFFQKLSLSIL